MDYKQAIIVRTDLGMSNGKIASQCSHASVLSAYKTLQKKRDLFREWFDEGMRKIILKVDTESKLMELKEESHRKGLITEVVTDAGKTQVEPGTVTSLSIGPDKESKIDEIVKGLKLL